MLRLSLFYVFTTLGIKTCFGILHLNTSCEEIYMHKNWHLLDNQEYCGTYDINHLDIDEYQAYDPEETEPPPISVDGEPAENRPATRTSSRILRGIDAGRGMYPWIAQLIWIKLWRNAPRCTGTVITKSYVLTAAHCVVTKTESGLVEKRPADEYKVRLGAYKRENKCGRLCVGFEEFDVTEIVIPNDLRRIPNKVVFENDIAMVRLGAPADFCIGIISPMCLPKCSMLNELFYGTKMAVAGFGATYEVPSLELPDVMQKFYPVVKPTSRCNTTAYIRDKMLCTGDLSTNSTTCPGDSGNPLMLLTKELKHGKLVSIYYQLGVLTFGAHVCDKNVTLFHKKDTVYTRVAYYMRWILDNIRE